jgi:hypothetical protein
VRSLDLPDEPEVPRRVEHADAASQDRPKPNPREMPDPDERGRAYEATRAHVSAETGDPSEQRCEGSGKPAYRDEVPKFLDMWADHTRRWPEKPRAAVDRSANSPENGEAIARIYEAEPRLSADAQAIEQDNKEKHGGWLAGFEYRRKDEDRLKEKIAERLEGEPDKSHVEILGKIPDAIRFTYCFEPDNYTRGYYDVKERFESRGHEMGFSQNWWTNPEYKGINTRWVSPEGQRFEVQFHTPDSFHAKHNLTHDAYERIRNPATSRTELRELHAFQREVSSWIETPDGGAGIPNYRKEGF